MRSAEELDQTNELVGSLMQKPEDVEFNAQVRQPYSHFNSLMISYD